MLQTRDACGHEEAEMSHMRIYEVDDALARPLQIVRVGVNGGNPAERLMRRRDVVAIGGENDERIMNAAQIDHAVRTDPQPSLFERVSDEQVVDDREHLFATEEIKSVPPPLKIEKSLPLFVHV